MSWRSDRNFSRRQCSEEDFDDSYSKLHRISNSFVEPHAHLLENRNRVLLKEGCVTRPARFKNVSRYCLLFNDVIVFAKPTSDGNKLRLKQVLDLRKVLLNNQVSAETTLPNPFCIRTREREYMVGAETPSEQERWRSALTQAVMKLRNIESPYDDPIDTAIMQLRDLAYKSPSQSSGQMEAVVRLLEQSKQKQMEKYHYETKLKERMKDSLAAVNADVSAWLQQDFMMSTSMPKRVEGLNIQQEKEETKEGPPVDKRVETIERHMFSFDVRNLLKGAESWDFDIFELDRLTNGCPLSVLTFHFFEIRNLFETFNIKKQVLANFIREIETGYKNNPYHNRVHGADVAQNTFCLVHSQSFVSNLDKRDVLSCIIAAGIHDYKHPGTNNPFQVATGAEVAIRYNDIAVLENMHVAEAYAAMQKPNHNIFDSLSAEDKKYTRDLIINMVLGTDMKQHFAKQNDFKSAIENHKSKNPDALWFKPSSPAEKTLALSIALHTADLGNPAKPFTLMRKWTDLVTQEFYEQGDKEKALGLPISPGYDRTKGNIPQSQIGFIGFIVDPLFNLVQKMIPEASAQLVILAENKKFWQSQLPPKEEKKEDAKK